MNKQHKKGFTLIEMLVVIAIIAVLVSILVPVVSNATQKANAAADAANLRAAMTEILAQVLDGNIAIPEEDPETWTAVDDKTGLSQDIQNMTSRTTKNAKLYYQIFTDSSVNVGFGTSDSTVKSLDYYQTIAETGSAPTEPDSGK